MQKKITIFCLSLLMAPCFLSANAARAVKETILTSSLLNLIDGVSFGVNEKKIHAMIIIRGDIQHILYGSLKGNSRVGLFTVNNQLYSVKQLFDAEKNNTLSKQALHTGLISAKKYFSKKIEPFLELAHGSKPEMLILIKESLRLHGRKNSILHMWAKEPEGDDMVGFEREVQSVESLYIFLNDLLNFIDDLISSTPKACAQYLDTIKNADERKKNAQRFHDLFARQKQKINAKAQQS